MANQHTPEPWKFLEQPEPNEYCLVTNDGLKWVIALQINGDLMPDQQKANARRIVACVNACAGLDTELLEQIVILGETLKSRFELMKSEAKNG